MAAQRVAIIGAGASGLCALKCCLDEGLVPTCFERSGDIGGLWRFEEHPEEGRASIYRSVIINTSKEMMCFSDFPIPEDFPNYMHNSKIMEYFRMAPSNSSPSHGLLSLQQHPAPSSPPPLDGGGCCSPSSRTSIPVQGAWRGPSPVPRKLSCHHLPSPSSQVFLSTKRGTWVLHRLADGGYPFDFSYIRRSIQLLRSLVPHEVSSFFVERKLNARFDHALYGLQPQHRIFEQHLTINDDLPNRIISGRVLVKPNIQEFTETSAIFEDGTREDIDAVVFATGYSFSFPFLEGCVKVVENQIPLYKFMFPPDLEKPTLAFIGFVQPQGAIMPISELQCRWATRIFKGLQDLPPPADMLADITQTKEKMAKRYVRSQRHTIQVDYIPYMDELACQVGVKPNLLTLFLTDPKLALEVAFGPCTPYQYRLWGPGRWAGAREAILTQHQRIIKPLQPRAGGRPAHSSTMPHIFKVIFSVGLIVATLVYVSLSP
ncbi:FMO5 monooxygenase, partial [Columbina picui]|nr:FMO5 monooxygenase [Columbina picui]